MSTHQRQRHTVFFAAQKLLVSLRVVVIKMNDPQHSGFVNKKNCC
jgi:hypothetical protein